MTRSVIRFILVGFLLSACAKDETVRAYGAADRVWHIVEIDQYAFTAQASLAFPEPGTVAGNGPCNTFTASLSTPYPWFTLGPITTMKRACPEGRDETALLDALTAMTLVEVLGDTMILSTPEGRNILLKADGRTLR